MSTTQPNAAAQQQPPPRPAWLDFENEGAQQPTDDAAQQPPRYETDPRAPVAADRSKALSVAMADDELQIEGQRYALISYVSPNGAFQHSDHNLVKIRGVFESMETARQRAQVIAAFDSQFDLYVVDLYRWVPLPPKIDIHREGDDRITQILNSHFDRDEQSKSDLESRIRSTKEDAAASAALAAAEAADAELGSALAAGGGSR